VRVLITGATGQVGRELLMSVPDSVDAIGLSRDECDVSNPEAVFAAVSAHRPDLVFNTAAYTAVEKAETERELAFSVNADGPANVAQAAQLVGARVIHLSTDYVFDGRANTPYSPSALPNPINVYGLSKLRGEQALRPMASRVLVVRTGWLHGAYGRNFVKSILTQARELRTIRVVNDQMGVPTSARDLAHVLWLCLGRTDLHGIHHWVNAGTATWYEFALAIHAIALRMKLISEPVQVTPITSEEYRSSVKRPAYSVLDAHDLWVGLGRRAQPWEAALAATLRQINQEMVG
jgi:dTDP-4-dehydrorhamnose reductase